MSATIYVVMGDYMCYRIRNAKDLRLYEDNDGTRITATGLPYEQYDLLQSNDFITDEMFDKILKAEDFEFQTENEKMHLRIRSVKNFKDEDKRINRQPNNNEDLPF